MLSQTRSKPNFSASFVARSGIDVADRYLSATIVVRIARQMCLLGPCERADDADAEFAGGAHGSALPIEAT